MSAAAEPMIETELWVSFVSMLRSYAAAASLHAGSVDVFVADDAVTITAGDTQLEMTFDVASSQVKWTRRIALGAPVMGSFTIEHEGTLSIDGASRDLDHAAIDFIASVTDSAKGRA